MKHLISNTFEDHEIRIHMDENNDIWFVAHDVMNALGIKYKSHALRKLDDSERGGATIHTSAGNRTFSTVSESGIYALILSSNKASAHKFRAWITKEVLPSIRKTGSYSVDKRDLSPLDILENHVRQMRLLEQSTENMANEIKLIADVAKQDDDTLTSDQIGTFDKAIEIKAKSIGDIRYIRYIRSMIKKKFFEMPGSRTYKEIARRDFDKALYLVNTFQSQPWMNLK